MDVTISHSMHWEHKEKSPAQSPLVPRDELDMRVLQSLSYICLSLLWFQRSQVNVCLVVCSRRGRDFQMGGWDGMDGMMRLAMEQPCRTRIFARRMTGIHGGRDRPVSIHNECFPSCWILCTCGWSNPRCTLRRNACTKIAGHSLTEEVKMNKPIDLLMTGSNVDEARGNKDQDE